MKKGTLPNIIMATIVTIIILGLTGSNALFGAIRIAVYGELDNLVFILPLITTVTAIYTIWLLVRRYPQKVREFTIFFSLFLGTLFFYISSVDSCPSTGLCLNLGPLLGLGIFLLAVFLLSLYYLAKIRLIERAATKRTAK